MSFTGLGLGYVLGVKELVDSYSSITASGVGLTSWIAGNTIDMTGISAKEKQIKEKKPKEK